MSGQPCGRRDRIIIVRTRLTFRLGSAVRLAPSMVVAYEADDFDPIRRLGWSVVVTGLARESPIPPGSPSSSNGCDRGSTPSRTR
ncbi:hypothetical protein [Nocardia sp. NBC_01009]|uniref:hypothetical protein n=1 Tax=Nocardia sp. NBC_01009 TaxID=2975996 RepID=UPI00386357C5|nr:pyridoxamine 5'-phosphate oxidase family protein [Nocardia sp. NBC_01009]